MNDLITPDGSGLGYITINVVHQVSPYLVLTTAVLVLEAKPRGCVHSQAEEQSHRDLPVLRVKNWKKHVL
jgi:hypothetical protein